MVGVDFVDSDASSVALTNGVVRAPIDGRLFRVRWYLCRADEMPFQRVESIRIAGRDVAPLTEWYPASGDFIMDLVLNAARDGESDSDRLAWANDVHIEARMKAVGAVVATWLTRLDTEEHADVRAEIARSALGHPVVATASGTATRDGGRPAQHAGPNGTASHRPAGLENTEWQVLSDLLTSADQRRARQRSTASRSRTPPFADEPAMSAGEDG